MASNSFGNIFKFTSFGESHGKAIGCIVDGVPPLIPINEEDIQVYLDRSCLLYTSPSPRDRQKSRMPSSA